MSNSYMKNQEGISHIPERLLKDLEEAFPCVDFPVTESIAELNFHYGQRSVIKFLQHHYLIQSETIINKDS